MSWEMTRAPGRLELRETGTTRAIGALRGFAAGSLTTAGILLAFLAIEFVGRAAVGAAEMLVHPLAVVAIAVLGGTAGAVTRYLRRRTWVFDVEQGVLVLSIGSSQTTAKEQPVSLAELEEIQVTYDGGTCKVVAQFDDARDVLVSTTDAALAAEIESALREVLEPRDIPVLRSETKRKSLPL